MLTKYLLMLILSLVVIEASFAFWKWYKVGGFNRRYWLMTAMLLSVYVPLIALWLALLIGFDDILDYRYHAFIFWLPCLLYVFLTVMLNILFPPLPFRMERSLGSEWSLRIVWCFALLLWAPFVIIPLVMFWDSVNLYERSIAVAAICAGGIGSSLLFVCFIRVIRLNNFEGVAVKQLGMRGTSENFLDEAFEDFMDKVRDYWK